LIDPATGIAVINVATYAGGITNAGGGMITATKIGIKVSGVTSFVSGNISNAGTISAPTGISIASSTITDAIIDTGDILGTTHGIVIDSASKLTSTTTAIKISGPTLPAASAMPARSLAARRALALALTAFRPSQAISAIQAPSRRGPE
jgi:hypothetical protein